MMDPERWERLRAEATETGTTISGVVRSAIDHYFDETFAVEANIAVTTRKEPS